MQVLTSTLSDVVKEALGKKCGKVELNPNHRGGIKLSQ